ncbi:LPXTG cell wall anchor domain-containing protein [Bacillus sp. BHET2]|uniref:TasA family protein n=1 Tax=Bacillus sp. BHET2 TaxID=2583818 RepID=UPI00110D64F7|nr:TasA family protein [Bacillus sp. BHET2]TMU84251.1 LPXTG cell wall anchor domain-containing protein [Bacillus sp. BHET2]
MGNKRFTLLTISVVFLLGFFVFSMERVQADQEDATNEVDIATSPTGVFFQVDNMKPGDWTTKTIKVKNEGLKDFQYTMSSELKSGSDQLYNALMMTVSDTKGVLYEGKVSGFKGFDARKLASSGEENMTFKIDFPEHLGNEFQGLMSEVKFTFQAEGVIGESLPVGGITLPNTGTAIYKLLLLGGLLFFSGLGVYVYQYRRRMNMVNG